MKRILVLLLAVFTLMTPGSRAENSQALYTARLEKAAPLKITPEKESKHIAILPQKSTVEILDLGPDWLLIRSDKGEGYIQRRYIDFERVEPVDPAATPPYPAILSEYIAWVADKTEVREAPDANAKSFVTLNPGARLAFIGVEDGWAKLIYWRHYAYVDTRDLSELMPLASSARDADGSAPIAAYTSFYNLATNEDNLNRMVNISVANDRMRQYIIRPGEIFDFNRDAGPYNKRSGYLPAPTLVDGGTSLGYGGGTCQVSSTLYNTLMQLPGLSVEKRRPHGPGGARYLPLHADAAVGNPNLNLIFRNLYPFPVRIDGSSQDGALTILIWPAIDE